MIFDSLMPLLLLLEEEVTAEEPPSFILPMLAIGAIFWFVMIAPERKRKKQRQAMIEGMKKGDKVMTTSGIYGSVAQVQGEVVTLQVADNVRIKFALTAVQGPVEDGTKKNADGKDQGASPSKNTNSKKSDAKAESEVPAKVE